MAGRKPAAVLNNGDIIYQTSFFVMEREMSLKIEKLSKKTEICRQVIQIHQK